MNYIKGNNYYQNLQQLIQDNILTEDEMKLFIQSNFPIKWSSLSQIHVYANFTDYNEFLNKYNNLSSLYHLRRELFYDLDSKTLIIPCNEGDSKIFQFKLQVQIMNILERSDVKLKVVILNEKIKLLNSWNNKFQESLRRHKINRIDGIAIGSMLNYNFIFGKYFGQKTLKKLDKLLDSDFTEYFQYRLDLIVLEEDAIKNNGLINQEFPKNDSIFLKGKNIINEVSKMTSKIPNYSMTIEELKLNKNLVDYIKTDYLYFKDRFNETSLFKQTLDYPQNIIVNDEFSEYQIFKLKKGNILNFTWIAPDRLGELVSQITKFNTISDFYCYGKCGILDNSQAIGGLILPIETKSEDKIISINNSIKNANIPSCKMLCVKSPLIETKNWLRFEQANRFMGIEMELYPLMKALKENTENHIVYYISDKPFGNIKLSANLDLLKSRLKALEIIFENILVRYE